MQDLIILSPYQVDLQNCLNTMYSFSIHKKTKIMIFQKRAKKTSDMEFHVGKQSRPLILYSNTRTCI